jgi:DNA-binding NarL/FixJ family response regulator
MAGAAAELLRLGRDLGAPDTQRRLVELAARILAARVLFVRRGRKARWRLPQDVHTLSSWTMHRLERLRTVQAFRVRPRPEFWRPEQRRPGALLVARVGKLMVGFARRAPFTADEVGAMRALSTVVPGPPVRQADDHPPLVAPIGLPAAMDLPDQAPFRSRKWRAVMDQVWKSSPSDCSIVLVGETGTGKEVVARTIHLASRRARGPFVAVNCGAIHTETLASELFGHVRGAFTGAHREHPGYFVEANRGTIFLDEVADLHPQTQAALLRALEERRVRPLGATRDRSIDVRVIAACHRGLAQEVAEGRFREDLFHRLAVLEIELPPLRARRRDLPLLAQHLLARRDSGKRLTAQAIQMLGTYEWPGNVRELDNLLQGCVLWSTGDEIDEALVAELIARQRRRAAPRTQPAGPAPIDPRHQELRRLLRKGWTSSSELARHLGVSVRTVNRDLEEMLRLGLTEALGAGRARRYRAMDAACRDLS